MYMDQPPNKCDKFLNPVSNKYNSVDTVDDLNVGIMTASKKVFDLGVKYTKDMFITITTAQATILVEASLKTVEHFMDKLKENPRINEITNKQLPKIVGLLDSSENILRYIGYDYLTKSYYNYASVNKPYASGQDLGFKSLLDLVSQSNDSKSSANDVSAINIVNSLTDKIMELPIDKQEAELIRLTDSIQSKIIENKIKNKNKNTTKQSGGKSKSKFKTKRTKRYRVIRKLIKRSIRKFCNVYPRIN